MKRLLLTTAVSLTALTHVAAEESAELTSIGAEVDRICFGNSINGWSTVDQEDNVVLLKRSANHWYWVELSGACDHRVLRRALTIGIDSGIAGGCVRRGDFIIVEDSPGFTRRCAVTHIYEWNDDAGGEEDPADSDE